SPARRSARARASTSWSTRTMIVRRAAASSSTSRWKTRTPIAAPPPARRRSTSAEEARSSGSRPTSPAAIARAASETSIRRPSSGEVSSGGSSYDFVPDTYLRAGGCSGGSELACDNGTHVGGGTYRASIAGSIAPGNPYYFFVDGGRTDYVLFFEPY